MYLTDHLPKENEVLKEDIQWFTFYNFYAQENNGVVESWTEAVTRATDNLRKISKNRLSEQDYQDIFDAIYRQDVLPSMRLFSMPTAAIDRCNSVIYNCSFIAPTNFSAIAEIMYLSLSGVGVGYSVEEKVINQLPIISNYISGKNVLFTISDTQTGWAESVNFLFETVLNGNYPLFDYTQIRPAGTKLKTKGGYASGPEPLRKYHEHVLGILEEAQDRKLTSLELNDIINMISETAISNGSRSGALICLFSDNDKLMLEAKSDPEWYIKTPWRSYSNNSMVVNGTTESIIDTVIDRMIYDKTGDPGLFNGEKLYKQGRTTNDGIVGVNPCLTGDTLVHTVNGDIRFDILAETEKDVDVYCLDNRGQLTIRTMHRPHKTGEKQIYEVEIEGGFKIKATENHKFLTIDNTYVSVENLQVGDSIAYVAEFSQPNKKGSQNYRWYNSSFRPQRYSLHRVIAEHYLNNDNKINGLVVHHIDYNGLNNTLSNLALMTPEEHDAYHRRNMIGDKNPMRRAQTEWTEEKWQQYSTRMSNAVGGEKNGRFSGYSHSDLYDIAVKETKRKGKKLTIKEWQNLSNKYEKLPQNFSQFRKEELGTISEFLFNVNQDIFNVESYSNHKIVAIRKLGIEPVYNGMVDEFHNYLVGGWEEPVGTRKQRDRKLYIVSKNCGEVLLRNKEFCNLSTIVLHDNTFGNNYVRLFEQARIATLIGTIQSMADSFLFLSDEWKQNSQEERLLGVCVTGIYDYKDQFDEDLLKRLTRYIKVENLIYSSLLGINRSTCVTSVKPSGNTSVLTNTSPGINPDFGKYQIRNIRVGKHSRMAKFLLEQGMYFDTEPVQTTDGKYLFAFPKTSNSEYTLETATLEDQLNNYKLWADNYTTHNVSVTITYKEHEQDAAARWIKENYQELTGMAFFPYFDSNQPYLPVQVVSEEDYDFTMSIRPKIDWSEYRTFDSVAHEPTKIIECSGDRCDIVYE